MDNLPTALILSHRMMSLEAFSALPDAPVVAYVEPVPPVHRSRAAAAALLHRLGDAMAPARPARGSRTLG
jgi:hypothetical protein